MMTAADVFDLNLRHFEMDMLACVMASNFQALSSCSLFQRPAVLNAGRDLGRNGPLSNDCHGQLD
jgi:hypothetical protein